MSDHFATFLRSNECNLQHIMFTVYSSSKQGDAHCTIQKNDIIDLHLHDKTHIFSSVTHKRALESLAIKITTSLYEQTSTHI